MRIFFAERARKDWQRLDRATQRQLRKKLTFYLQSANPLRFAEKLRDYAWGEYRFRIGEYRIVFDVRHDAIFVLRVGHRKDIYRA